MQKIIYNNIVYIYPSSLQTEDVFLKSIKQVDDAVKLKSKFPFHLVGK